LWRAVHHPQLVAQLRKDHREGTIFEGGQQRLDLQT
jgi:hypothetical protein